VYKLCSEQVPFRQTFHERVELGMRAESRVRLHAECLRANIAALCHVTPYSLVHGFPRTLLPSYRPTGHHIAEECKCCTQHYQCSRSPVAVQDCTVPQSVSLQHKLPTVHYQVLYNIYTLLWWRTLVWQKFTVFSEESTASIFRVQASTKYSPDMWSARHQNIGQSHDLTKRVSSSYVA
jgi:hypothetical protein